MRLCFFVVFSLVRLGYEFIFLGEENATSTSGVKVENGKLPKDFLLMNY